MTDMTTEDSTASEREIRRAQDKMSRTVDKISEQLSVKNLLNALLDKADENDVDARMLVDGALRNPIALGLIAAGATWLISDKDSKLPSLGGKSSKSSGSDLDDLDIHHRAYVSHMSTVEQRAHEDAMAYQRRRDIARSNFFMVERDHEEDDSSFRQRLDRMTDKFREKRCAWAESSSQAQVATKQKAQAAVGKAQDLYAGNPLVGGILDAAVGAAFGSALPITRQEQDKLGSLGEKAREVIDDDKEQVTSQLREKKDELLDKANAALQPSTSTSQETAWLTTVVESLGRPNFRKRRPFGQPLQGDTGILPMALVEANPLDNTAAAPMPAEAPAALAEEDERLRAIYEAFDASQPVREPAALFGRDDQLRRLLNGIFYRQNHGVISGPRGSGKTSLARICAKRARAEGVVVLYGANDLESSFGSLMRQFLEQIPDSSLALGEAEAFRERVKELHAGSSAQEVANLLSSIVYSTLVMIIDEFDRVPDESFKYQISSLLKLSSDDRLRARFVLVGDERTYPDLLQGHASLARHTSNFLITPLTASAISELLESCGMAAGLNFSSGARQTVSDAACGSPYHARLFGLHAALRAHAENSSTIQERDAKAGLTEAFVEWESVNPADAAAFRRAVAQADGAQGTLLMRIAENLAWSRPAAAGLEHDQSVEHLDDVMRTLHPATVPTHDGKALRDVSAAQFLIALAITTGKQPMDRDETRKEMAHS